MKTPTIEEVLGLADLDGYKLNNLCKLNTGLWRANFRTDVKLGAEMGEGRTPLEALLNAYGKARIACPPKPAPVIETGGGIFD